MSANRQDRKPALPHELWFIDRAESMFAEQFKYAVLRPNIPYYLEGSTALQLALQEALTGQKTPKEALDAAAAKWLELAAQ